MKRNPRLLLIFAIQLLVLVYIIADRQWLLASGTVVTLETEPVDPRSLFSGDYVRLNYKISRLSLDRIGGDRDFSQHGRACVLLRPGERYAEVVSVHHAAPTPATEQVVLCGEVQQVALRQSGDREIRVRYGIEGYFVPEGEGRAIERPAADEKVSIRVAVDTRGRGAIQALLINGHERYIERLF